ncbi:hypothetical protein P4261_28060 [Bacillus thuringiensis]|nr:hypothetical protein [Bacillus thuringiensis]MED2829737.1 hypothetical protein [Bacillus thuringiensis]MED2856402.1 hypothetical protein [Bacillus thuringiensis]MED2863793.1 hypothetical protein [Bacillus thuringiensis]
MLVQLIEPKEVANPLHYGDIVEVTFTKDYGGQTEYYILSYNDDLTKFDGAVRYGSKYSSISAVIDKLNNDRNIASWRALSKNEYTVQIHKNARAK